MALSALYSQNVLHEDHRLGGVGQNWTFVKIQAVDLVR